MINYDPRMQLISVALPWVQLGLAIAIIVVVLLQRNEAGLGAGFGASGGNNFQQARRGIEKLLLNITIILGILFALSALAALFIE